MINKFLKLIATISIVLLSITSLSIADNHISKKEMISELKKEITDNYKLVIILSSFQVISKSHGWEKWNNFPVERKRLLNLLSSIEQKVLILSGDRHVGGFYKTKVNLSHLFP